MDWSFFEHCKLTDTGERERVRKEVRGIERWLVGFLMALEAFGWHCQPRRFVCVCRREEGKLFWRVNTLHWRCGLAADVNLFRSQMAAPWSLSYDVLQEIPVCRHGNSSLLAFWCQLQPSPLSAQTRDGTGLWLTTFISSIILV